MKICASRPAAAAYAAKALPALPAEGIANFCRLNFLAMLTAQERPRALKEPVGLRPSSFTHRFAAPRRCVQRCGADQRRPAFLQRDRFSSSQGKTGAYRHILLIEPFKSLLCHRARTCRQVVAHQQGPAALTEIQRLIRLKLLVASTADEIRGVAHRLRYIVTPGRILRMVKVGQLVPE